jgi:4-hydroxybenzoate polyprenyltransferase
MQWIKSLRLSICAFVPVLVLIGFSRLCNLSFEKAWLCGFAMLVIACATMVYNDWRDRFHDVRKGKTLAHTQPRKFFFFTVMIWLIAIVVSLAVYIDNPKLSVILWVAIALGLIYSETRKIPMVPIFIVSITSASPVLFPLFLGHSSPKMWLLFFVVGAIIFGRELIKDLEDVNVDHDYKWTLPLRVGTNFSERLAAACILVGWIFLSIISIKVFMALPLMLFAIYILIKRKEYSKSKKLLDINLAMGILIVCIYW